jgi:putative hydrolase of the HAD superfamily
MFDDLPHNLATAHAIGMTTVLVDCRSARPEHQASAGWTELPDHIHHRTERLAPFLDAIAGTLARAPEQAEIPTFQAQFCLT